MIWPMFLALAATVTTVQAASQDHSAEDWQTRSIYQVLTDRFAHDSETSIDCTDINDYCGGTWKGVSSRLDYIRDMNFLGMWISPITANSPGGYHGYWPTNFYHANTYFGSKKDLKNMIQKSHSQGVSVMVDVVINHVGYINLDYTQGLKPFYSPDHFHDCRALRNRCKGCDIPPNSTPDSPRFLEEQWNCRFNGLPDLNHSKPYVQAELKHWAKWLVTEFDFRGVRIDSVGHVPKEALDYIVPALGGKFSLNEGFFEYVDSLLNYTILPENSFLNYPMAFVARSVFGNVPGKNKSMRRLSEVYNNIIQSGLEMKYMGTFIDNHDLDRFLTIKPQPEMLRNALVHTWFIPGIPILYYGTEQEMEGNTRDKTNRQPLWNTNYSKGTWGYVFVRMLNWYRYTLKLWEQPMQELYVDDGVYAFQRGPNLVVIVQNGEEHGGTVPLSGLLKGTSVCRTTDKKDCIRYDSGKTVNAQWPPNGEPGIYVSEQYLHSDTFFEVEYKNNWVRAILVATLTVTISAIAAIFCVGGIHVLARVVLKAFFKANLRHNHNDDTALPAPSRHKPVSPPLVRTVDVMQDETGKVSADLLFAESKMGTQEDTFDVESGVDSETTATESSEYQEDQSASFEGYITKILADTWAALMNLPWTLNLLTPQLTEQEDSVHGSPSSLPDEMPAMPTAVVAPPTKSGTNAEPQPKVVASTNLVRHFHDLTSKSRDMVVHVALEYAINHLGMQTNLMFGGLGLVVDIFMRYSTNLVALVAPMWAPFYADGAPDLGDPIMNFEVVVETETQQVEVFLVADPSEKAWFFLVQADVFKGRDRGNIYTWKSENEQLTFFSVFNQAVAVVACTFRFDSMQFHDYHGVLSLMYMPPQFRPHVLYVAHNADYNGSFPITSRRREHYIYAMFNLEPTFQNKRLMENQGCFDILYNLVCYLLENQQGYGVVAVSPRYAPRIAQKFSQFWRIPQDRLRGVLNGLDGKERQMAAPDKVEELMKAKGQAKEAWQQKNNLNVGKEYRVMTFLGRMTYQKGCDIICECAKTAMKQFPKLQLAMAGPVGDQSGREAKGAIAKLAADFPGRVLNMAGEYVRGSDKDQLMLATDFFLCPSRFEPCGLADIEFGWQGSVMVGHNTGGLGKLPGFYFSCDLDNVKSLGAGLEQAISDALIAPDEVIEKMAFEAAHKTFPPDEQVRLYNEAWTEIRQAASARDRRLRRLKRPVPQEKEFFEDIWAIDNLPKVEDEYTTSMVCRAVTNILLIMMQGIMRVPIMVVLLLKLQCQVKGSIESYSGGVWSSAFLTFFLYFIVYAASTLICQVLAFFLTAKNYIQLTIFLNLCASVIALIANYQPGALKGIWIATAVISAMWAPLYGYIFLDTNISISKDGPKIMIFSQCFVATVTALVMGNYYQSALSGFDSYWPIKITTIACTAVSTFITVWFLSLKSMNSYHHWFVMRPERQVKLMRRATAWMAVLISTGDAFFLAFLTAAILVYNDLATMTLYQVLLSCAAFVFNLVLGVILSSRLGLRWGVKSMYVFLFVPGLNAFTQMLCVVFGADAAIYVAAAVLSLGMIRSTVTGLLSIHTIPTRETYVAFQTLMIFFGNLALACGGWAGAGISRLPKGTAKVWFLLLPGLYELARIELAALLVRYHRRESLAVP